MQLSILSRIPPCPGKKLPESFNPAFLFIIDSVKSPTNENNATIIAIKIPIKIPNFHLSKQPKKAPISIENNNVISEMLIKLGANVRIGEDIFDPEPGAYGGHQDEK